MGDLSFRVLGPVEAFLGGVPVRLGGPSVSLLAGLLLSANRPVGWDRLAEVVWGEGLPAHPRAALQSLKSRLRRALAADAIEAIAAGYRIVVADDALDLLRFERLVEVAESAADQGRGDAAVAALDEAVGLWSLPVLANVRSDVLVTEEADVLAERYLSVQGKRAALQLELGNYPAVINDLGPLQPAHPLREDLAGLLMVALYRGRRQADALAVYERLRRELRDSLGVDPGEPLQRLHLEVLRQDGRLDQAADPPWPGVAGAVSLAAGGGPCPGRQEADDGLPPTGGARPAPRGLPPDAGDFTGRGAEVKAILQAVGTTPSCGVIVVAGPAGVGKSALAVHAGHELSGDFPGGQVYLDAAPDRTRPRDPASLLTELTRALGGTPLPAPATVAERASQYRSLAAGRRLLLIVDNAASEAQVRDLQPPGPGSAAIICARRRLAGFPGARLIDLTALGQPDALALLGQIIGPGRLAREPRAAAELARLCGGLPLALRIAGSRLAARPHWRLAALAARLANEQHRLDELTYGDLSVRASIAASCAGLPPGAPEMLRKLATLQARDLPLWAAAALLDGQPGHAQELCEALADARLLDAADSPFGPCYTIPDLIRAYARQPAHPQPAPHHDTPPTHAQGDLDLGPVPLAR